MFDNADEFRAVSTLLFPSGSPCAPPPAGSGAITLILTGFHATHSKTHEECNNIAFIEAEENPLVAFLMGDDIIAVKPWSFFNKSNTLMSYVNRTLPKGSVLSDELLK